MQGWVEGERGQSKKWRRVITSSTRSRSRSRRGGYKREKRFAIMDLGEMKGEGGGRERENMGKRDEWTEGKKDLISVTKEEEEESWEEGRKRVGSKKSATEATLLLFFCIQVFLPLIFCILAFSPSFRSDVECLRVTNAGGVSLASR